MADETGALALIGELEKRADATSFKSGDIRRTFHLKLVECLNAFYFGHLSIALCSHIEQNAIKLQVQPGFSRPDGLETMLCLCREPWSRGYKSSLNRHLIMDSWAAFEASMGLLVEATTTSGERIRLQQRTFEDVLKLLNKSDVDLGEPSRLKLERMLTNPHIPIPRLFGALVKAKRDEYGRDYGSDSSLLDAFGRLRNASHANFVYRGPPSSMSWDGVEIRFRHGESVWFSCSEEAIPKLLLGLVDELSCIYDAIARLLDHNGMIPDSWETA